MASNDLTRVMLKLMKDIALQNSSIRQKLDSIVQMIAQELCVGVCSIYLLNKNNKIELYATEGLSKESISKVVFDVGVGIVGQIFKDKTSINVSNVWNSEFFIYYPETAEDPYYTMLGVPIVFADQVIGALTIQNRPNRPHPPDHMRILAALSPIIAELILNSDLSIISIERRFSKTKKFRANFVSSGFASGRVIRHTAENLILYNMLESSEEGDVGVFKDIFKKDFSYLSDEEKRVINELDQRFGINNQITQHVKAGLTVVCAVFQVYGMASVRLDNEVQIREILRKFSWAVMLSFFDYKFHKNSSNLKREFILISKALSAGDLLAYIETGLAGLVVEWCSEDSHTAILARSFGIPIAYCSEELFSLVGNNDYIVMNSKSGVIELYKNNAPATAKKPNNHVIEEKPIFVGEMLQKNFPGISLRFNLNLITEAVKIKNSGLPPFAGLVRTETLFGHLPKLPTQRIQEETYKQLFSNIPSSNCRLRLFDIIFQHVLHHNDYKRTANTVDYNDLGFRGARMLLENKDLLLTQVKALLNASGDGDVYVSVPMVSCLDELLMIRDLIRPIKGSERLKLGMLVEVPSVVSELESFMKYVDFLQIGTNDLLQFFYAIDRNSSTFYKTVSLHFLTGPFIRLLRKIRSVACAYKRECILCGVAATRPLEFLVLYEIGFRDFSVPLAIKREFADYFDSIDLKRVRAAVNDCIESGVYDIMASIQTYLK